MKIVAIRIKNLASLEGLTEIDFTQEPLCSAGIFAITGPTGSGKSTILDALCLGLYARTPRYLQAKESNVELHDVQGSKINQSDVRGILRDGTADGFAEVDFIGVDGQKYRATWNVRRSRNKVEGSLQSFTVALKNISTNTDIPGRKAELQNEIERLVGLNFEQFTRSVLLAQGDFTAFLKAGRDEKSSLLEKLTGTEIYSQISTRIFEKYRDEAQELKTLNLQREGISTLTTEELTAFETEQDTLDAAAVQHEKKIDDLTKEIAWHKQAEALQTSLTNAHTDHAKALDAKQQAAERALKLKQVENVQPARTWVEGIESIEAQLSDKYILKENLETSLRTLGEHQEASGTTLQQANEKLVAAIHAQEEAQPMIDTARSLDVQLTEKSIQVDKASEELSLIQKTYAEHQTQLADHRREAEEIHSSIGLLTKWKEENSTRQAVAEHQTLVVSKLSDAQRLLKEIETITSGRLSVQDTIRAKTQEKETLAEQHSLLTAKVTTDQQAFETRRKEIDTIPVTALEKEQPETDAMAEDAVRAEAHWKTLFAARQI